MKKLFRISLLYSIASGITRGAIILYAPVIANKFSLEQFGTFNLAQLLVQLLAPFLGLNAAISILREGLEDSKAGKFLYNKFFHLSILFSLVFIPVYFFIRETGYLWIYLSAFIAIWEAVFNSNLSYLRFHERHVPYFGLSVIKIGVITAGFLVLATYHFGIDVLLLFQLGVNIVISLLFYLVINFRTSKDVTPIPLKPVFRYSLPLIPHSIGQWIMNSSNRFIIKETLGLKPVGIFSVGVNVSMVLNLINSGISIILPNLFVKNYEHWKKPATLKKFFLYYAIAIAFVIQGLLLGYWLDMKFLGILKYYSQTIVWIIILNSLGYFFLGLYFIYTNFLFYLKKTDSIAITTILCAVLNTVLTWAVIRHYNLIGASVSVAVCYFLYLIIIKWRAERLVSEIRTVSAWFYLICFSFILITLLSGLCWVHLFN